MPLTTGSRLGPYDVLEPIGAGGMGQVFRARDTRLNRVVALKAMNELVGLQPENVARFEREAHLLASLNHPNIAAIHGVEEAQGSKFLVLEFIEGRPLSDVIAAGPVPLDDALAIAKQIAAALAAAHERGIIHRDLKPGNVMVTADGEIKVLDFGLGKAIDGDRSRASDGHSPPANSPTITMAATQAGIILGTAGYMSPEQAKGRGADKRSDVWAFGCVLFELLAGKRAFDGDDVTEVLAAIVRGEPDWNALPATVPAPIHDLVRRCLIKNRAERLADMSVVQFLLSERASTAAAIVAQSPTSARSVALPVAAAAVVAACATAAAMYFLRPASAPAPGPVSRVAIPLPDGDRLTSLNMVPLAIAPDGTTIVYIASREGRSQLFIRSLSQTEAQPITGTEGVVSPFFSPDSQWIGFFADGKVKRVAIGGTALQIVADAPDGRGGTWGTDDTIYFAPTGISGIWKVPASGGTATALTQPDRSKGEVSHRWPHAIADEGVLLFSIWTGPGADERQIVRQSLDTGERHVLLRGGDTARYLRSGHLLYGRLDGLFALPWTPAQRDLTGIAPIALAETPRLENEGGSDYAVSTNGTLVYIAGGPARLMQRAVWVNRDGSTENVPAPERDYESVSLSPDGRHAILQVYGGTIGLWMYDFARQTLAPFSKAADGSSQAAVWTPDSKRLIYRGTRQGFRNIFWRAADGTGAEERLTTKADVVHSPTSVSPDGRHLVFTESGGQSLTGAAVWMVPLTGERTPALLVQDAVNGHVSPDGRWLVFEGLGPGTREVFAQSFPGAGARHQISIRGGTQPRWSRDGRQLYYVSPSLDRTFVVDIAGGPSFSASQPRVLHQGTLRLAPNANTAYDVDADGRMLHIQQSRPQPIPSRIEVVLNWFETLARSGATAK